MKKNRNIFEPKSSELQSAFPQFLEYSAHKLLDEFGAGSHKPGSGCAAALMGILACRMLQTVITVTERGKRYEANREQLRYIGNQLAKFHEPFFKDAFQRDPEQFDRYFQIISAKNATSDQKQKKKLATKANKELRPTTEIPLGIASQAVKTTRLGLTVFDLGARHVRGDSGAAISAALGSGSTALFIVYLNLRTSRGGDWATKTRTKADDIAAQLAALQNQQNDCMQRLRAEGIRQDGGSNNRQQELSL